ncbi:MAG: ornithine cyclodeaminase family protein [Chlamydiae bacterium]|nr:ornithine cyclodeaminase family protein [Chlamydiota bacterium]MBI3265457.1 ornithine cyclodeaminase family protein [Chlamydiota bacterium]
MIGPQTLLLTSQVLQSLVHERDALEAMKDAFGARVTRMPSKLYLDLPSFHGDFRAMPGYIQDLEVCGLKWVNSHPDNLQKKEFPAVMGILILNDPSTGFPLAILDGTFITRMRTGAAGALASQYLARSDSKILALVGCGVQAEAQMKAHLPLFQFSEIRVWGLEKKMAQTFLEKMKPVFSSILVCDSAQSCVEGADIICTTTPSRKPLIEFSWLKKGCHINAMGADAPGKQELHPMILKKSVLVIDEEDQCLHGGEMNVGYAQGVLEKSDIDATLGEIVLGSKKGRTTSEEITVFDSTGLAVQDLVLGKRAYEKALKEGLGQWVSFF